MRTSKANSLTQLAAVMVGFMLTILLLESEALFQWAQRLEVNKTALVAVQATGNLHRFLQPLNVEWVRRQGLADLDRLGWSDDPARLRAAQSALASAPLRVSPCTSLATTVSPSVPGGPGATLPHVERIPLSQSTPRLTPLPQLPAITNGQPRVVALAGDSMMAVGLGNILLRQTAADPNVRVIKAFRSGTGLARPDVFDWMEEYPAMIGTERPDAVIVAIGANDGQGFIQDGKVLAYGSDAWVQVYQQRIAAFLTLLTQNGAAVVWVGLPPMRSNQYNEKATEINRVAYSVVSQTPHATWWNPLPYIGDESGAYREFQTAPDGRTTRLRGQDGIHLSDEGAMLITPLLISWLNAPPQPTVAQAVAPKMQVVAARKASRKKARR
jgi:hypothetical protein